MPTDATEDETAEYECDIQFTACGHVNDGVHCGPDEYKVGDDASGWMECGECNLKYTNATVVAVRKMSDG